MPSDADPNGSPAANRPDDSVPYIERTRALYASQRPYAWRHHDREAEPPPFTPISQPLSHARVALLSSGGVYAADQEPFHFRNDTSHREIPLDTPRGALRVAHFGYDTRDAKRDPGCVLPLTALREVARAGVVDSVAPRAFSFMGGIYSQRRVEEEVAPRFLDFVLRERASLALLVPV